MDVMDYELLSRRFGKSKNNQRKGTNIGRIFTMFHCEKKAILWYNAEYMYHSINAISETANTVHCNKLTDYGASPARH